MGPRCNRGTCKRKRCQSNLDRQDEMHCQVDHLPSFRLATGRPLEADGRRVREGCPLIAGFGVPNVGAC